MITLYFRQRSNLLLSGNFQSRSVYFGELFLTRVSQNREVLRFTYPFQWKYVYTINQFILKKQDLLKKEKVLFLIVILA